ncbi:MAG TPA: response regulator transcription factor [Chloroflexota bacterium]|nr:response regulator transcription factor [Chloroflexota bacterium]
MATKAPTLLLAEDDPGMLRLVRRSLELAGYRVLVAEDGTTALDLASSEDLAMILLDIGLPGLDGLTVCRRVREFSDVYIIMITAWGAEEDIVRGLEAGADDYLPKPFGVDQLLARVKAVLRRARAAAEKPSARYTYGDLSIDFATHRVTLGGVELRLTPTEYQLLASLASYPGLVLTQHQLLERVWGAEYAADRHLLHVNIARVRRKIEPSPDNPRYLLTRPGVGYYLPKPE